LESKNIRLTSRSKGRQITHAELSVNQNMLPFVTEPKFQISVPQTEYLALLVKNPSPEDPALISPQRGRVYLRL